MNDRRNDDDKRAWRQLAGLLDRFREMYREISVNQALMFLYIAQNDGEITQADLAANFETSNAAASRNIAVLSVEGALGKPGLGLVVQVTDPMDRRRKYLMMTPKGRDLAAKLADRLA